MSPLNWAFCSLERQSQSYVIIQWIILLSLLTFGVYVGLSWIFVFEHLFWQCYKAQHLLCPVLCIHDYPKVSIWQWLQFIQLINLSSQIRHHLFFIFYFPLLKLRISQLSQPSLIAECGHQLVHKIAWYLSQSVGFKNKQQFLTTKAVIKQASFHKSWTRKMHQKCCLFVLHSQSYLNNALLKINHGHVVLCFSRRQTGSGREDRESKKWLSIITYTENTNWQLVVSNRQNNYSKHMSINASLKMSPTTQTPCCHRWFFSRCKLAFFSLLLALILMHIASRGNMDHACNLRGFLTNHMFKRATGSFQCLCLAVVCGYVCVCHECNSLYTS